MNRNSVRVVEKAGGRRILVYGQMVWPSHPGIWTNGVASRHLPGKNGAYKRSHVRNGTKLPSRNQDAFALDEAAVEAPQKRYENHG